VALMDISAGVRRKSPEGTGVPPLPNALLEILRVVENHPGITVAEVENVQDLERMLVPGP
jgi:hypothetical protein